MSYNDRENWLTGNKLSDEWYTPKFIVDKCLSLCSLQDKKILCPFDSENSIFVKELKAKNVDLIYGINDFVETDNKPTI